MDIIIGKSYKMVNCNNKKTQHACWFGILLVFLCAKKKVNLFPISLNLYHVLKWRIIAIKRNIFHIVLRIAEIHVHCDKNWLHFVDSVVLWRMAMVPNKWNTFVVRICKGFGRTSIACTDRIRTSPTGSHILYATSSYIRISVSY